MYCRNCHYDLRHLPEPRCPECGRAFDPALPRTYLTSPRSWPLRALSRAARLTGVLFATWRLRLQTTATILLVMYFAAHYLLPSLCIDRHVSSYRWMNLVNLVWAWQFQRETYALATNFDIDLVRPYLRPSCSEWSSSRAIGARRAWYSFVHDYQPDTLVVTAYCAFMILLLPRRWRRRLLIIPMLLVVLSVATFWKDEVAGLLWPGDFRYINDYVFVDGLDWDSTEGMEETVIAYERRPWQGKRRVVAFMDRHQVYMPEKEFQRLAAEQGLDIPEPE